MEKLFTTGLHVVNPLIRQCGSPILNVVSARKKRLNDILVARIRRFRRELPGGRQRLIPLTQKELATRAGVSSATVSNVEGGKQLVSIDLLYRFCEALGVELVDLLPPLDPARQLSGEELEESESDTDQMEVDGELHDLPREWASAVKEQTGE